MGYAYSNYPFAGGAYSISWLGKCSAKMKKLFQDFIIALYVLVSMLGWGFVIISAYSQLMGR
jgi:hypothetical protein